jgi:hypothetical protein
MHGETSGSTFGFIAARAACYPVIRKSAQLRPIRKELPCKPASGDPGIRWLLLNTERTNRSLKGTG